jgi:formylglycine-generating enzyme required for sulfatase activity
MNSFEIAMRPVASGRFVRGYDDHNVQIQNDFWISAHEISQRQWSQLMNFNPSTNQGNPYSPVDNVSWVETASFCEALTTQMQKRGKLPAGYIYRLPTESEWTFAALGGGDNALPVDGQNYWHWDTSEGGYRPIGVSGANKLGVFDMSGNVEEWTLDQFNKRSGKAEPDSEDIIDPVRVPPAKSFHAVVKGGSWSVGPERGGVTRRSERISNAAPNRGFRVVLAPAPKK